MTSTQGQVDTLPDQVKNNPNISDKTKEMLTHAIHIPRGGAAPAGAPGR